MDPLTIVGTSFSLAGAIARAATILTRFSRDFPGADDDLKHISSELQALSNALGPISRILSRGGQSGLPVPICQEVDNTLHGCLAVVVQVEEKIQKYNSDKAWSKQKWALFGQDDMNKLRESLGFYNVALSIGLHAMTIHSGQEIKDIASDEEVQTNIDAVMSRTDDLLARVKSIRQMKSSTQQYPQIEQWIEDMALLSSYAESSYKETVVDPAESTVRRQSLAHDVVDMSHDLAEASLESAKSRPGHLIGNKQSLGQSEIDTGLPIAGQLARPLGRGPVDVGSEQSDESTTTELPGSDPKPNGVVSLTALLLGEQSWRKMLIPGLDGVSQCSTDQTFEPRLSRVSTLTEAQALPTRVQGDREPPGVITTETPHLTNICLDGIEDMAGRIRAVAVLAQPDGSLINASQTRRQLLGLAEQDDLDRDLNAMNKVTSGAYIRGLIASGADPNRKIDGYKSKSALRRAFAVRNLDCICALLQGGANPDQRPPLISDAAGLGEEAIVWALVAAGATVVTSLGFATEAPLKSAVQPDSSALDGNAAKERQLRIVRFLVANGADAGVWGFQRGYTMSFRLMATLTSFLVWSSEADRVGALRTAELMLQKTSIDLKAQTIYELKHDGGHLVFVAAKTGNEELLRLLGTHIIPYCQVARDSPDDWGWAVSVAAKRGAWGCVEILARPPYTNPLSLLYLIASYMETEKGEKGVLSNSSMEWTVFSRATRILLENGADVNTPSFLSYKGETSSKTFSVIARLSALQLVIRYQQEEIEAKSGSSCWKQGELPYCENSRWVGLGVTQ